MRSLRHHQILRRDKKRYRRKLISLLKLKRRRKELSHTESPPKHRASTDLIAPVQFSLAQEGQHIIRFFRAIERNVIKRKLAVRLIFKQVKMIHLEACILLYAEIDRITQNSEIHKPITVVDPWRRRPREVLKQIGIHEMTRDSCDIVPEREDVVFWKAVKGTDQSGDKLGPVIEYVANTVNKTATDKIETSGIWRGVSEAMTNTIEHAFEYPRRDKFMGKQPTWTIFTQVKDGMLTVAVCDLGCGYGESVARTIEEKALGVLKNLLPSGQSPDTQAILLAMEYGRTRTEKRERGKGSRDALAVLTEHKRGAMFVYSNTGYVRYSYSKRLDTLEYTSHDLDFDIFGTIIGWILPIERD